MIQAACSRKLMVLAALVASAPVLPAADHVPALDRVEIAPGGTVPGGIPRKGEVWLTAPASATVLIRLSSSAPDLVMVPDTTTVPIGHQVARFRIETSTVTRPKSVSVTAEIRGSRVSTTMVVVPPALALLSYTPSVVVVGSSTEAHLGLRGLAPQSGWPVTLSQRPNASCTFIASAAGASGTLSSNGPGQLTTAQPVLDFPSQVTIPAGESRLAFPMTATGLPQGAIQCRVTFEAAAGEHTVTRELTVSAGLTSG